MTDIVRDIVHQDPNALIVVCGDFNNHMDSVIEQLQPLDFAPALEQGTETHRLGGHLDQVFVRTWKSGPLS